MIQEYMPTTEEVCEWWTTRGDIGNPYETDADFYERHHEEKVKFDRWLAAHDADVLQRAMAVIAKDTVRKGVFES